MSPSPSESAPPKYASRGGLKLAQALEAFELSVEGLVCADFGCSTGGFTDCLLRAGAARVTALDTGYGVLDYRLRVDPRVEVRERTNVLHVDPPDEPVDLVTADLSWTRQDRLVPVALAWLHRRPAGRILSLVKPHYEIEPEEKELLDRGVLPDAAAERICLRVQERLPALGVKVLGCVLSPIRGGGSRRREGNLEYIAYLAPSG